MAYIYTPFMKKVLHITKRKRKSNVHHYCKTDDFRAGFEVAKWGTFCHSAWLQISPARFKQVYSDSAHSRAKVGKHARCILISACVRLCESTVTIYASQIHSVRYLPVKRAVTSRPTQCASCFWTYTKQLASRTRPVTQAAGHTLRVWPTRV